MGCEAVLSLDDSHWNSLKGGYLVPYDPRPALRQLERGENLKEAWNELWQELHHQRDLGEASYATIPVLVDIHQKTRHLDWNLYALAAVVEVERHAVNNPPLPEWLVDHYKLAWQQLLNLATEDLKNLNDPLLLRAILSVIALAKGNLKLGALVIHLDEGDIDELVEEYLSWGQLYEPQTS